jgi:hypothetical protein
MRSIRIALVAALAVLAPVLAGSPAQAGGPTSVLLVAPGESQRRTAALYNDNAGYIRLTDLLNPFGPLAGTADPPNGASGNGPLGSSTGDDPDVTLTWLMHDVAIWRVDRIYLSAQGGPWIATQQNVDGNDKFLTEAPVWHQVGDRKALVALLDEIGVGPAGARGSVVSAAPSGPVTAVPPVAAEPAAPSVWAGWWWGPAGLLLGALGVLVLQRRRRAVSPPVPEPDDAPELWDAELDPVELEDHRVTAPGA